MTEKQHAFFPAPDRDGHETLARRTDPDTSHEAARQIDLNRARLAAVLILRAHPGSTASELDDATDALPGAVRKRLPELAKRGLARKGEKRKCRVTGRRAYEWWPV